MSWKELSSHARVIKIVPAMSIMKNGRITWNEGMQKALGNPEFVKLLVDEEQRRIGLVKAEISATNFGVRKAANQGTWGISAYGALRVADLTVDKAYRNIAQDFGDGVWGIPLPDKETESGG